MKNHFNFRKHASIGLCAGIILAITLSGCKNPSQEVVGHWTLDAEKSSNGNLELKNNPLANQFAKTVSLDIKPDKTFSLTILLPVGGTYTMSGDTINFHVDTVFGYKNPDPKAAADTSKDLTGTLSPDGKSISVDDKKGKLVFIKADSGS